MNNGDIPSRGLVVTPKGPAPSEGIVFGIRTPPASRYRSAWAAGRRITDPSTMFGPYIDILEDRDFSLQQDPLAYEKMMRDCQIRSCIRLRQLSTASRRLEFLPREDSDRGRRAAKFVSDLWARVRRPTEVLLNILDAIPRGSSFNEIVWKPDKKHLFWFSEDITPAHKDRFAFSLEGELVLRTPYDVFYGQTLPPRVIIHHRYDPEPASFYRPESESRVYFGYGEFDRIYPWFFWKLLVLRLGFAYLDRLAYPIKVGRYPYRNADVKSNMETYLKELDHHRVAMWPNGEGWDVDFLQTSATGHNVGMEWINYIDTQIAKVILGSTLMQQPGERGSFALGAVHTQNVFGALTEHDSLSLCDTIENTWAKWVCELNAIPTELTPKVEQATGKSMEVNSVVDMMLLLAEKGFPVSVEQVSELTGIRPARQGETLLALGMDGEVKNLTHGPESALAGATNPKDLLKISDTIDQDMPKKKFFIQESKIELHSLNVDITPESDLSLEEVQKHAQEKPRLYKKASPEVARTRVGPIKYNRIKRFASEARRIIFDYVNLKGERKTYDVEPYSYRYRRGFVYLYAFDPVDLRIKSFFAHKLRNVKKGKRFNPRWVVEL